MLLMILYQFSDIHIGYTVTVRQQKGLVPNVAANSLHAAARHCVQPGVHHRHLPRLRKVIVYFHGIRLQIKGDIRRVQKIVRKKFFDHMLLVSRADHEVIEPIVGILFHDVPQDRLFSDFNHGFRTQMTLFRNARPESTCQQDYFHNDPSPF